MSLCRISVHADLGETVQSHDVVVGGTLPAGMVVPLVVDLLGGPACPIGARWELHRPVGPPIDHALSLTENGVADGDLLLLTPRRPQAPPAQGRNRFRVVAGTPEEPAPSGRVRAIACAWTAVVASISLMWTGIGSTPIVDAIAAACGAAALAWAAWSRTDATLGLAAAALAAAVGAVVVPSGPDWPNVFLGATAAFAVALCLALTSGHPLLVAVATATGVTAAAAAVGVGAGATAPAVGTLLAAAAAALLGAAPRLAATIAGLGAADAVDVERRAHGCHDVTTGLVWGCGAAAAGGAMLVAWSVAHASIPPIAAVGFAASVGLALVFRSRVHAEASRRIALTVAGSSTLTAAFAAFVIAAPQHARWAVAAALAVGLSALLRGPSSPAFTRAVDALDLVALVAIVPLGGWVLGVYALARDWQLS